ncbi:MAG TPA: sulfate ABC transporter permease subunit CysT [Tepidisphaeraceae bacterium]|jgi:sulfate transport system permease protein
MPQLRRNVLPGFRLSLGYTLFYLSLIVLIPLAALAVKSATLSWNDFYSTVTDPFVVSAYKLSIGASLAAAAINGVFGLIVAWVLVRYPFPGRKIFDAIVDLPFALPTAVAGIAFASVFSSLPIVSDMDNPNRDWYAVTLMLVFVGLPFVIRTVQPVLQDWETETEQAAMSLGAGPVTIFRRVIFPVLFPAWISGVALAFARCVGEYGSVIFVSRNIPGVSQIVPQIIVEKLIEPTDANGVSGVSNATAVGLMLLLMSLSILLVLNFIDAMARRHER